MNLNDFGQWLDHKILHRGSDYYENDYIETIESTGEGSYLAIVTGSSDYEVRVSVNEEGDIVKYNCTCPYDWGAVCKHQVAVFYHLEKHIADGSIQQSTTTNLLDGNNLVELQDELEELGEDRLIELLLYFAKKDKNVLSELKDKLEI